MLSNSNKHKRIFSAILLSLAILIAAKEFKNEIINDKTNEMNNNSGIVYLDDNKMVIDGQIVEVADTNVYNSGTRLIGNSNFFEAK